MKKRKFINSGNFRLNDTYIKDSCLIAKLGIDHQIGNDATRGVKEGDYIIISKKRL